LVGGFVVGGAGFVAADEFEQFVNEPGSAAHADAGDEDAARHLGLFGGDLQDVVGCRRHDVHAFGGVPEAANDDVGTVDQVGHVVGTGGVADDGGDIGAVRSVEEDWVELGRVAHQGAQRVASVEREAGVVSADAAGGAEQCDSEWPQLDRSLWRSVSVVTQCCHHHPSEKSCLTRVARRLVLWDMMSRFLL